MSAVEWKTLGEVCSVHTGEQLNRNDMIDDGKYPVINGGKEPSGYTNSFNELPNSITISQGGESAGYVNWITQEFWAGAHCYVVEHGANVIKRFLYHSLKNIEKLLQSTKQGAGIPGLNRKRLYDQVIPIPSLSKQQAIVSHLDAFTTLISSLESELEKRRKQYEHYRNQLLEFEGVDGVEWKTMGDIGDVCMCKRIMKEDTSEQGDIPFFKIGTFGGKADAFISYELYEKYKNEYSYPKKGDILISASGTIGRLVVFDGNDAYFQDSNIVWIDNNEELVLNAYLKYYYQIVEWKTDGGTIKRLYNNNLRATRIAIPSLATQQSIVEKLATFEQLNQSLETEIKLRKQQYEYYREKLLTFE